MGQDGSSRSTRMNTFAGRRHQAGGRGLRILVVGLNFEPEVSGIAPYTSGLAHGLTARGHDVEVVTGYPHYPQWHVHDGYAGATMSEDLGGIRTRRLRHFVPDRPTTARRIRMELDFGLRAVACRWGQPEVVVLVSPALVSSMLVAWRARRAGIPVVTWVQDIYTLGVEQAGDGRLKPLVQTIESRLLEHSSRVVVIHDRFRHYLQTQLAVRSDVDVVRNWSHVEQAPAFDRAAVRRKHGWAEHEYVVLHAGNMGAKQGLENVVRASRIASDRRLPIRFVLLGDGLRRRDLEALDPNDRLQFIDPLPDGDFEQALGAADALLVNELPGLTEMSVPSKLTTYWSTGRPVIAAADVRSTTAEEIAVSRAGVLVLPNEPEVLIDAVEGLAADPELGIRLADAGKRFRHEHLSPDSCIDAFEAVLRNAVAGTPSAR